METKLDMERIKERQKQSFQGMFYSIQRIDLLIVSISGAGIYVCLETLKYLSDKNLHLSDIIKVSGGLLLMAVIINFISQFLGHMANYKDYLYCEEIIEAGEKINKKEQSAIDKLDYEADCYSKWTVRTNYISSLCMFIGLISLISYFLFIF